MTEWLLILKVSVVVFVLTMAWLLWVNHLHDKRRAQYPNYVDEKTGE